MVGKPFAVYTALKTIDGRILVSSPQRHGRIDSYRCFPSPMPPSAAGPAARANRFSAEGAANWFPALNSRYGTVHAFLGWVWGA